MTPRGHQPAGPDRPGGLGRKQWGLIAALLLLGLAVAALLVVVVPTLLVSDQGYRCPTAAATNPRCVELAGKVVDQQALDAARASARAPFGLLSTAVLAGIAALIGVVVSDHNARLTKEANKLTADRDRQSARSARETAENARTTFEQQGDRDR